MKNILIFIILFPFITLAQSNCNCCTKDHKDFDFWIGEWNVFLPNGSKAGENTIVKVEDNCVLKENWKSTSSGYSGTSYNFYNLNTQKWEQLWIDNKGQHLKLSGKSYDNTMVMTSTVVENNNGSSTYNRITWTKNNDDSVRQLWENITLANGNKTVKVVFDGLYKRKIE